MFCLPWKFGKVPFLWNVGYVNLNSLNSLHKDLRMAVSYLVRIIGKSKRMNANSSVPLYSQVCTQPLTLTNQSYSISQNVVEPPIDEILEMYFSYFKIQCSLFLFIKE